MKYDVRDDGESKITEIVFSDEDSLYIVDNYIRFKEDGEESNYAVHVSHIDDMIAALQKAKEVWL